MTDLSKMQRLQERVKELEAKLENAHSQHTLEVKESASRRRSLNKRLQLKEAECISLQDRLQKNEEKFDALKSNIENSVKVQAKVYDRHNAQVESLKALAEKDRAWLEEETSKRRAASIAMRKRTEVQVTRMQRRISTGW